MGGFLPIRLLEVELGAPLPAVEPAAAPGGGPYRRARALVRLHGRPLGLADLTLEGGRLAPDALAARVWAALAGPIRRHLAADGAEVPAGLPAGGLPGGPGPDRLPAAGLGAGPCRDALPLGPAPPASVVVATRDRPEEVVACLEQLLGLAYPDYEVLVVDNAPSSDATAAAVGRHFGHLPQVRYVREDRPGLSNARNRGLAEAAGEVVAFTDDDVLVDRAWLANLVAALEAAPHAACATGLILPAELDTEAALWFESYAGFAKGWERQVFDLAEHRRPGPLYPYAMGQFGSGASLAFKTAALRRLGGFAAELGAGTRALGGEDLDVFLRLLASGAAIVYEPGAILRHRHLRDSAALRRQLHGYGVGLGAALTKCVVDRPGRALELAARLPAGLAYLLSPASPKNRRKQADFPAELTRVELRGVLAGPAAYLRSRRQSSQTRT
jgi:GT2 family glycosyltransferase